MSRQGHGVFVDDLVDKRCHMLSPERRAVGEHLVEYRAEREDVAAVIDFLASRLLRAHVRRRSDRAAFPRESRLSSKLRQPEIYDLHLAVVRDEDV